MIILLILTKVSLAYVFNVRGLEVITDYESAFVNYGNEIQSKRVQIPGRGILAYPADILTRDARLKMSAGEGRSVPDKINRGG